jgi:hypothetical protein
VVTCDNVVTPQREGVAPRPDVVRLHDLFVPNDTTSEFGNEGGAENV